MDEIELEIQKNTIIVLGDDKKLDELHMLRKDFKKLRYSIELIAKEKRIPGIKSLKNIQDVLGEIHDHDMTVEYLKNTKQNSKYSEIIEIETQERSKKYQEFVTFLKKSSDK